MNKYICSECNYKFDSEQKPEFCPECRANASCLQLSVNDEMVTTMGNLRLLRNQLNSYADKIQSIKADYQNRLETLIANQNAELKTCDDQLISTINGVEKERADIIRDIESEYKQNINQRSSELAKINKEKSDVTYEATKMLNEARTKVANGIKHNDDIMAQIRAAEAHIIIKKYHKMAKDNSIKEQELSVLSMSAIMMLNPQKIAEEINDAYTKSGHIFLNSIKQKCSYFYSIRKKAESMYQVEKSMYLSLEPKATAQFNETTKNALITFSEKEAEIEKNFKEKERDYYDKLEKRNNEYDKKRIQIESDFTDKKKQLFDKHKNQLADLECHKKQNLISAYELMKKDIIEKAQPKGIIDAAVLQETRRNALRNNFELAKEEPENITVGLLNYKMSKILGNRLVSEFMTANYREVISGDSFVFPFTVGLNQNLCMMFKYNNAQSTQARDHIQNLCLTAFLETPPNKMRFHFFDPLKSGQSFAVFKHFEDDISKANKIILGGIQTDPTSIEQQLQIVVDHIKAMQINTFKGQYNNIREYNEANTLNPQPYNIVGIMDFPAGFTAKSVDLLQQIVATGKECGVYAFIMCNTDMVETAEAKIQGQIKTIEDIATVFSLGANGYNLVENGQIDENMVFTIDPPMSVKQIMDIAPNMRNGIEDAGRVVINYEHVAPPENEMFKCSTDEGLIIPIGMTGASDIQYLTLGRPGSESVHALIVGQIGSGKSRLLHAIITSCLLKYPKDELEIFLVDFKSGTEFKIYADYNLPNFKVVAIESEQEFGLSVLRYIMKESDRRAKLFNSCSDSDITTYNNSDSAARNGKLPRILVVIDEFHELFNSENKEAAEEASRLMENILRLKRSFGVHVILCTQSVRGMKSIGEPAMAQIAVRIALKCPKEDADIVLGEGSDAISQIEENDAGSAIYLPAISTPKTNNKFRVGYLSKEKHNELLKTVEAYYEGEYEDASWNTRVLVSNVADSRNSVFQEYIKRNKLTVESGKVHFGESLKIDKVLSVSLEARKHENLLLAGRDVKKAQSILFFITLDLVLQKIKAIKEGQPIPKIYVFNFNNPEDDEIDDRLQELTVSLPDYIEGTTSYDAIDKLTEVFEMYNSHAEEGSPVWIIVSNLELAVDFQSSIYSSSSQGFAMFEELLNNGPSRGYHTICWHSDLALLENKYPNTIQLFEKRIAFNMSKEDAKNFASIVDDSSINKNNAMFFDARKGNQKFRPYSEPTTEWIASIIDKISSEQI